MGWERKPVERETSRLLLWINQMFLKSQGKCLEFPILWKHGKLSATSGCCAKLPPLTRMQGSAPGTDALIQNVGQGISKTCISGWMDKKFCPLQFYWVFLHIASFPPFYFAAFFCISNRCFVLTLHIEQFFCHTRIPAHYRNQPQVKCGFLEVSNKTNEFQPKMCFFFFFSCGRPQPARDPPCPFVPKQGEESEAQQLRV